MECLSKTENSVIVYLYDIPSSADNKRRHFEKCFEFFFSYNESQWESQTYWLELNGRKQNSL